MESLAVKYRPKIFEDVVSQKSIIKILQRQIDLKDFSNVYLFCGPSGCGKTTIARIFANMINNDIGQPIEIDGASNNGVDNIKSIVATANQRALDSKYKIYIIDECHALTSQVWQAFLKCIEEPPEFTIFIFCTTDPQKIPATILNRVMRFNFTKITHDKIRQRLEYICLKENFTNYTEACDYISKISNNQMRDSIATLEKCSMYNTDLNIKNVQDVLGNCSYELLFDLMNFIIDNRQNDILSFIDYIYSSGYDMKLFINQMIDFCLDITKYIIFNDIKVTKIPTTYIESILNVINFESCKEYYLYIIDKLLELKNMLKNDNIPYTTIVVVLLQMARCK